MEEQTFSEKLALAIILATGLLTLLVSAGIFAYVRKYKAKRANCKHDGGWNYKDANGTLFDISESLTDVTGISFDQIKCKKCKKSLAEINY